MKTLRVSCYLYWSLKLESHRDYDKPSSTSWLWRRHHNVSHIINIIAQLYGFNCNTCNVIMWQCDFAKLKPHIFSKSPNINPANICSSTVQTLQWLVNTIGRPLVKPSAYATTKFRSTKHEWLHQPKSCTRLQLFYKNFKIQMKILDFKPRSQISIDSII